MHRRINILFVTGALSFGGLERVLINLCRGLNKDIFRPVVVCLKSRGELASEIEQEGIPLYSLEANKNRKSKYITWLRLRQIIKKEGIDLVHSHNTAAFLDSVLSSIGLPVKLVHTDHARDFPDKWRYMAAERIASIRAREIVAVSEQLKKELVRYEKIPSGKISVILNGVEISEPQADKDYAEIPLPAGFQHVVGLGVVLTRQKGITHLIQAAEKIIERFPDTAFLIAGDGPERKELEAEVEKLGLAPNFIFLGFRRDIPEILSRLDIYVLPSEWEGFPLCILEAMAARKCILSTNVGGIPKALRDNENAILIPPGRPDLIAEKSIYLLENPDLRARLAEQAYKDFKARFDVKEMVSQYEALYLRVLDIS